MENLSKNRSSKFARNGMLKKKEKKKIVRINRYFEFTYLRRGRVYVYQMKIKSKVEDKPCPGVGGRGEGGGGNRALSTSGHRESISS